jgi:hypothetical protein
MESLLPELLAIIFDMARRANARTRARLRCVSLRWHGADREFVAPAWTSTHPDLAHLGDRPWRLWHRFCCDVAQGNWWPRVRVAPVSIAWCARHKCAPRARRLRIEWLDDILSITEFWTVDVLYWAGSTKDAADGCEYTGPVSKYIERCLPRAFCIPDV